MQVNEEDRLSPQEKNKGNNKLTIGIVALVIIVAGIAYYLSSDPKPTVPVTEVDKVTLPDPAPTKPILVEDKITEPDVVVKEVEVAMETPTTTEVTSVIPVEEPEKLPSLDKSDPFIEEEFDGLVNGMNIDNLLVTKNIARQVAVFVDNLALGDIVRNSSPLNGPNQGFAAVDISEKTYLDPNSYYRYDIYANLLTQLNTENLLKTYKQIYPLFEQAFGELGYSNISFNQRVKQSIREILEAPIIEEPIELSSISVNYQFSDPKLEELPAAQKLMIRMGPENTKKIKKVLSSIKSQM